MVIYKKIEPIVYALVFTSFFRMEDSHQAVSYIFDLLYSSFA